MSRCSKCGQDAEAYLRVKALQSQIINLVEETGFDICDQITRGEVNFAHVEPVLRSIIDLIALLKSDLI